MPQPPENDAGLTAPRPEVCQTEVFLGDLNLGISNVLGGLFPLRCAMRPLAGPAGARIYLFR